MTVSKFIKQLQKVNGDTELTVNGNPVTGATGDSMIKITTAKIGKGVTVNYLLGVLFELGVHRSWRREVVIASGVVDPNNEIDTLSNSYREVIGIKGTELLYK